MLKMVEINDVCITRRPSVATPPLEFYLCRCFQGTHTHARTHARTHANANMHPDKHLRTSTCARAWGRISHAEGGPEKKQETDGTHIRMHTQTNTSTSIHTRPRGRIFHAGWEKEKTTEERQHAFTHAHTCKRTPPRARLHHLRAHAGMHPRPLGRILLTAGGKRKTKKKDSTHTHTRAHANEHLHRTPTRARMRALTPAAADTPRRGKKINMHTHTRSWMHANRKKQGKRHAQST